jgi:hypothetical protein
LFVSHSSIVSDQASESIANSDLSNLPV